MLREQFAAIVSHELKSPLGAVQQSMYGLASDLEDKLSDEQKNKIERLQSRIADLIKAGKYLAARNFCRYFNHP